MISKTDGNILMMRDNSSLIFSRLSAILSDIRVIPKTESCEMKGRRIFSFRGIDNIYNELHHLFAKHGVVCSPVVLDIDRREVSSADKRINISVIKVKYVFYSEDGSFIECISCGEGMDYGDKSVSKALAIAHKYALLQMFLIPTDERSDPDYEATDINEISNEKHVPDFNEIKSYILSADTIEDLREAWTNIAKNNYGFSNMQLEELIKIKDDLKARLESGKNN